MANDYGALSARILDELDKTGEDTTQVQAEIKSAIAHYEQERWYFDEETTYTLATPSQATMGLPPRFLDEDQVWVDRNGHPDPPLTKRTWAWYRNIGGDDANIGESVPDDYLIYNELVYLYPIPDQSYTVHFSYRARESTLSASADTNNWCVAGEELIRQRAKAAYKINIENDQGAIQQSIMMAQKDSQFLSRYEEIAYNALKRLGNQRMSAGIVPMRF